MTYGRFMGKWADPRAVAALEQAFARYDEREVWRALQATMDLFRWLSVETARALSYVYPAKGARQATDLVQRMESTR